jgi:hypothetical protein
VKQAGDFCRVSVTTNLTGRVYWHWYVNGRYAGMSRASNRVFPVPRGAQANITSKPVRYASYNGAENEPLALSGEVTLEWTRSVDANIDRYLAQYQSAGGPWVTFAKVRDSGAWSYRVTTPQLDDDVVYSFRVVPVDAAGNDGTAADLGSERIVRYPTATDGVVTFNPGPTTFTFDDSDAIDMDWLSAGGDPVPVAPVPGPIPQSVFVTPAGG